MDVSKDGDVARALALPSGQYDVILDDSSHEFDHQIRIIKEGFPLLKPGGYLIVEDVFRSTPEERYEQALNQILPQCAEAYFVICNHEERYSPGWNNDKLLVLVKGPAAE
jgi:predicted O-methyltransferase YrrM